MTLQQLLDRAAIHRLHLRYACPVDSVDLALFRSVYTGDPTFDRVPGKAYRGMPEITGLILGLLPFDGSRHCMANEYFDITSDRAAAETYALATHWYARDGAPTHYIAMIRYHDDLVKTDGHWQMDTRTLRAAWTHDRPPAADTPNRRRPASP
ncbi:MAG: nuclear transport factor 2 family protein [Dehalococcoidia bacterium]|nr:nuclear transport factor 2 family protein [Dehalococcoidia bacterium]